MSQTQIGELRDGTANRECDQFILAARVKVLGPWTTEKEFFRAKAAGAASWTMKSPHSDDDHRKR